jgi:hypothetical protein
MSRKEIPSNLDFKVIMLKQSGMKLDDIAKEIGLTRASVDYHIQEAKRLVDLDLSDVMIAILNKFRADITIASLEGLLANFKSTDPEKYGKFNSDAAIRWVKDQGLAVATEVNVNLKPVNSDPEAAKQAAIDAIESRRKATLDKIVSDAVEPEPDTDQTPTSTQSDK